MQTGGGGSDGGGSHAAATYSSLRRTRAASHAIGEINVTPLVDVVLVLLLVFMVTAPMMNRAIDVSLPVANQPQKEPDSPITVSMNASGQLFIGDKAVNAVLLEDRIRALMENRTTKVVYLRADEALRYGRVIAVIDKLKTAGVDQVGFVYVLPQEKAAPR